MIAKSEYMTRLEVLDLRQNKIGNHGFKELIKTQSFPKLLDLRIDANKVQEAGAKLLTYGCTLDNLTHLTVRGNMFGSKGCQFI